MTSLLLVYNALYANLNIIVCGYLHIDGYKIQARNRRYSKFNFILSAASNCNKALSLVVYVCTVVKALRCVYGLSRSSFEFGGFLTEDKLEYLVSLDRSLA